MGGVKAVDEMYHISEVTISVASYTLRFFWGFMDHMDMNEQQVISGYISRTVAIDFSWGFMDHIHIFAFGTHCLYYLGVLLTQPVVE